MKAIEFSEAIVSVLRPNEIPGVSKEDSLTENGIGLVVNAVNVYLELLLHVREVHYIGEGKVDELI